MFNLLPGIHPLTFGLGQMRAVEVIIPEDKVKEFIWSGQGAVTQSIIKPKIMRFDNPYISINDDDDEIIDILTILFGTVINE